MNQEPSQPRTSEPEDDRLDALLAQARWPEPTMQSQERLLDVWEGYARPRRYVGRWIAVAAMLLIAIGSAWKLRHTAPPLARKHDVTTPRVTTAEAVVASPAPQGVPSRPANAYERLVFLSARPATTPPTPVDTPRAPPPMDSRSVAVVSFSAADQNRIRRITVERDPVARRRLLSELLASPKPADLEAFLQLMLTPACRSDALAVLRESTAPPDAALLFARFNDARVDRRFAAAKALGTMCSGPVQAELRRMVQTNSHRREALAALLCCEHGDAAEYLAAARMDRSVDAQIRAVRGELDRLF
jgi:hypothetical protein